MTNFMKAFRELHAAICSEVHPSDRMVSMQVSADIFEAMEREVIENAHPKFAKPVGSNKELMFFNMKVVKIPRKTDLDSLKETARLAGCSELEIAVNSGYEKLERLVAAKLESSKRRQSQEESQ